MKVLHGERTNRRRVPACHTPLPSQPSHGPYPSPLPREHARSQSVLKGHPTTRTRAGGPGRACEQGQGAAAAADRHVLHVSAGVAAPWLTLWEGRSWQTHCADSRACCLTPDQPSPPPPPHDPTQTNLPSPFVLTRHATRACARARARARARSNLTSSNEDIWMAAKEGVAALLMDSTKVSKTTLQQGLRPLLSNLGHHYRLTLPILQVRGAWVWGAWAWGLWAWAREHGVSQPAPVRGLFAV